MREKRPLILMISAITVFFITVTVIFISNLLPSGSYEVIPERGGVFVSEPLKESERVNINTATLAELCTIPGIGETLGQRIIDCREENGPFASPEDITQVRGIGEGTYDRIMDYITTGETEGTE